MGCKTKHDSPYCSTTERKIRVDVAEERRRIDIFEREVRDLKDNGTESRRRRITKLRETITDAQERIAAVSMGCAIGVGKGARSVKACSHAEFVGGVCVNCGTLFGSDVAHGSQL